MNNDLLILKDRLKKLIMHSPAFKTAVFASSVILSGILCSSFVTEINIQGVLIWSAFYKTYSFYLVLIYLGALYVYNRYIYQQDKNISNFLDEDYCKAYIRSQFLPEIVERYKDDVRKGKHPVDLKEYHEELEKILK